MNVKIGRVSSVNVDAFTARVILFDSGNMVSGELKIVSSPTKVTVGENIIQTEKWIPEIGQNVVCAFLENGDGDGVVLGGI